MVYPAKRRYDAANLIPVTVRFNRRTDPEAAAMVESIEKSKRAAYIKALVRADVERRKAAEDQTEDH